MKQRPFLDRLAGLSDLTPSEKKLARHFEQEYPSLAFDNLASLSGKVKVGKSTVSRFIARLGYKDFHVFLRELRDEVAGNLDNPLKRHAQRLKSGNADADSHLHTHLEEVRLNLQQTTERIRQADFTKALNLLCDEKKHLYMIGCASAEPLVSYFYLLISYMRGGITLLDGNAPTIAHRLAELGENAMLFAMAFNRYPTITSSMLRYFKERGSQVVLLTDRHTCPMLNSATVPLIVHAEGAGMFKTRCSAMAVMEALLAAMAPRFEKNIPERYTAMRDVMQHLNVYISD